MIFSTAVIKGFKNEISEKIFGFWGNVHVTDIRITRNFELKPVKFDPALIDSVLSIGQLSYTSLADKGKEHKTMGGVSSISSFITMPGILNSKTELEAIVLKGVDSNFDESRFKTYLMDGRFPNLKDSLSSRDILISEQTQKRLQLNIDDKVNIYFVRNEEQIKRRFQVCGIYKTGLEEYDRKFAFMDLRTLQGVLDWNDDQIGGYEIFLDYVDDAEPIADYIHSELLPPNLFAETIQEKHQSIFEWLELQDINEYIILLLMTIVAIINMSTAILILILDRSRMIGILKSLGNKDWEIRKIFIYSALYITSLSLIFGNLIGLGLAFLQKNFGFLKLDEENYYLSQVPIDIDIFSVLVINIGTIGLTFVFMILPTYLVTRISPIKVLRFD